MFSREIFVGLVVVADVEVVGPAAVFARALVNAEVFVVDVAFAAGFATGFFMGVLDAATPAVGAFFVVVVADGTGDFVFVVIVPLRGRVAIGCFVGDAEAETAGLEAIEVMVLLRCLVKAVFAAVAVAAGETPFLNPTDEGELEGVVIDFFPGKRSELDIFGGIFFPDVVVVVEPETETTEFPRLREICFGFRGAMAEAEVREVESS